METRTRTILHGHAFVSDSPLTRSSHSVSRATSFANIPRNSFLSGFAFYVVIISLPQRFQIVNGASPSSAGFHLIPLLISLPLAGVSSGALVSKMKVAPVYVLVGGGALQVLGIALMGFLSSPEGSVTPVQYCSEFVIGFGFGFNSSTLIILLPLVIEKQDTGLHLLPSQVGGFRLTVQAVGMGTITQIHLLGSAIGLALATNVFNNRLERRLPAFLTSEQVRNLLESTDYLGSLSKSLQHQVKRVYAEAYDLELKVMVAFTFAALSILLMLIEKKPRRLM